jgi:hypothetical protein
MEPHESQNLLINDNKNYSNNRINETLDLKSLIGKDEEDIELIKNLMENFYSRVSLNILKFLYIIKEEQKNLNKETNSFKKLFSSKIESPHIKILFAYLSPIYNKIGQFYFQVNGEFQRLIYYVFGKTYFEDNYYEHRFLCFLTPKDKENYKSFINLI